MSTPPPKMPRAMGRADRSDVQNAQNTQPEPDDPSASQLVEALFLTIQALKSTGRDCTEEADPALRAISMPRGRVLKVVADAEAHEEDVSMPASSQRGRHRTRVHETMAAQFGHHHRRMRMGDLAQMLGMTARNVTTIVDGLEHEGLLARRQHPDDRRAFLLELTEKGRAHIAQIHALHDAIAERFIAPLDAGERGELRRLLAKLQAGAGSVAGVNDHGDTL